jgi:nicotinate-nucleotide pyrophosphorylase (carboxylating)
MTEEAFIRMALEEDLGAGDHTSMACLQGMGRGNARLVAKEPVTLSGIEVAAKVFKMVDADIQFEALMHDGDFAEKGSTVFRVSGAAASLLTAERLALNFVQRMSGVASLTRELCDLVKEHPCILLDTRKTTPGFRQFEKRAVVHGGGQNHRFGLFDMILIKDNHIDFCGGVTAAIQKAKDYLRHHQLTLPIVVEVRNEKETSEVLSAGGVFRILLDNFSPDEMRRMIQLIDGAIPTEASGGINRSNIRDYAATGVNYISMGALTHSYRSMDLSLKAE